MVPTIHLAVVACGDHLEQALMMIKSAVLLTRAHLLVHIYAEAELQPQFNSQVRAGATMAIFNIATNYNFWFIWCFISQQIVLYCIIL